MNSRSGGLSILGFNQVEEWYNLIMVVALSLDGLVGVVMMKKLLAGEGE